MTLRGYKNISLRYSLCGKLLSSCLAAGDRQLWKQQAALKMTCAKPPLESSRRLFKASFELKYQVFVVFSKTLLISILLFLFIASIFMLSTSFIILFSFLIFQIYLPAIDQESIRLTFHSVWPSLWRLFVKSFFLLFSFDPVCCFRLGFVLVSYIRNTEGLHSQQTYGR